MTRGLRRFGTMRCKPRRSDDDAPRQRMDVLSQRNVEFHAQAASRDGKPKREPMPMSSPRRLPDQLPRSKARPSAPALMLCNSLGTDLHMWDDQAPAWSQGSSA